MWWRFWQLGDGIADGLGLSSVQAKSVRDGMAPQPAYQCVTEMVPYTVMKNHWRTEYETVTQTVMVRQPITNYVERQRVVCKPVFDTIEVPRQRVVCKPIHETDYVTQTYTVCKPVQSDPAGDQLLHATVDPACDGTHRPQVWHLPQRPMRLQDRCHDDLYPCTGREGRGHDHHGSRNTDPAGPDSSHQVCPGSRE